MKKQLIFSLVLVILTSSIFAQIPKDKDVIYLKKGHLKKALSFYTFNVAFQELQVITQDGQMFKGRFVVYGSELMVWWRVKTYSIIFPKTDGRNATVLLKFRGHDGEKKVDRVVVFKLADHSYGGHPIKLSAGPWGISMFSNFGPVEENLSGISYWRYPEDSKNYFRPGDIDYNKKKLEAGDLIWVNGVDIGDGPWCEDWFDENGYVYSHHFGSGESGKLRPAIVVEVLKQSPHRNHSRLKVKTWYPWAKGKWREGEYYSHEVILEQKVVLINW